MNKKFVIISIILFLILIFSIIIFITLTDNQNDDIDENNDLLIDDISLFIGKWDDLFYSLDDNSYGIWEFYENNSIKNTTSGLPYGGADQITIIKWHEFKLKDNLIYLKFEQNSDFSTYSYVFTNSNNHLSIYYINDVLGIPMISLNRISN